MIGFSRHRTISKTMGLIVGVAALTGAGVTPAGAVVHAAAHPSSVRFTETDLVSDIAGRAAITDPKLVNPWGISHSPTSPVDLRLDPGCPV